MNFDKQFKGYHGIIKLSSAKKKELTGDGSKKGSRDALRDKIKKNFRDNERKQPKFYMQGSFSMTTTVNPISLEYDLDDGVYLQNIDTSKPMDEWEKPEKVHKWIVDAVDGHTSKDPTDKNLCVRVHYADEKKHIDLPIYAPKDDTYYGTNGLESGKFHICPRSGTDSICSISTTGGPGSTASEDVQKNLFRVSWSRFGAVKLEKYDIDDEVWYTQ